MTRSLYDTRALRETDNRDLAAEASMLQMRVEASKRREAQLTIACRSLLTICEVLTVGETCDHSVGICWCGTFADIADAKDILEGK